MKTLRTLVRSLLPSRMQQLRRAKRPEANPRYLTANDWDIEYVQGKWDYLASIEQLPRYCVIAGLASAYVERPTILDLGCGMGDLLRALRYTGMNWYRGVDHSEESIKKAAKWSLPNAEFMVADISSYLPERPFDCVILNEVLYYLPSPSSYIKKMLACDFLQDSHFVISIYYQQEWVWGELLDLLSPIELLSMKNERCGKHWKIALMKKIGST